MPACRHCGSPSRGNPCWYNLKRRRMSAGDRPCDREVISEWTAKFLEEERVRRAHEDAEVQRMREEISRVKTRRRRVSYFLESCMWAGLAGFIIYIATH